MNEITLTQNKVAFVDDKDFERVNRFKWYAQNHGNQWYAVRNETYHHKKQRQRKVQMHRFITGISREWWIDHVNGEGLDNRRNNLRPCTNSTNQANRKTSCNKIVEYKGVYFHKKSGKYMVRIQQDGYRYFLGEYYSPIFAAEIYDKKAVELFGEYAKTNFGGNNG